MLAWLLAGALALAVIAPGIASAQKWASSPLKGIDLLTALREGGFVLYFRHTDTDWSQSDTRGMRLDDCAAQRNLSARGRDNARAIGSAIRSLGIPIGSVLASPLCRTVDTAMLAFDVAEKSMAVREGGPVPPGAPGRFEGLRALLSAPVARGANLVLVGHAYPFYSLVGAQYLDEGEAGVVRPGGADFEVVARVGVMQWRDLALAPAGR